MLTRVLACLALLFIATRAQSETYKEVHPKVDGCANQCYEKFWAKGVEDSQVKCDACCTGCTLLAAGGLTSHNDVVQSEEAKTTCYNSCSKETGANEESCKQGCDFELEVAKKQLKELDLDFNMGLGMLGSILNSMPFAFPSLGLPVEMEGGEKEQTQPQTGWEAVPVIDMTNFDTPQKKESEDEDEEDLWKTLMQQLGFLDGAEKQPKKHSKESDQVFDSGAEGAQSGGFALRDDDKLGFEDNADQVAYLRSLWRDRNTVQILLISSITACLFAILWMVYNNSSENHAAAAVLRRSTASGEEEPPSYNVIYGDEKKLPILIVAGIEDQAGPLPDKVPLGHSTRI